MSRNQDRMSNNPLNINPEHTDLAPQPSDAQITAASPFNFVVPTEAIDLPSAGKYYPIGHPLHNKTSIEIRHMTAKEEDILTSATLLKKGLALDKMLQSIIVDKKIRIEDLLVGDKNALLVASRVYGYGAKYDTEVECAACKHVFTTSFDLDNLKNKEIVDIKAVTMTESNTFKILLPKSNLTIEFRLLTSKDENVLANNKIAGSLSLLKTIVLSVNEQTDSLYITRAIESLPILDVSILKKAYTAVMPDLDMTQMVECENCNETANMGVPLDAGFFWPNL